MRSGDLAKIAAEAEILRIKHLLKRQGLRVAFGLIAIVFLLGVLVLANIAVWQVLRMYISPISATLVLLGINLLLAIIFGLLAARSSPSRTEREALAIRQRALGEARNSLALGALVPAVGTFSVAPAKQSKTVARFEAGPVAPRVGPRRTVILDENCLTSCWNPGGFLALLHSLTGVKNARRDYCQ